MLHLFVSAKPEMAAAQAESIAAAAAGAVDAVIITALLEQKQAEQMRAGIV